MLPAIHHYFHNRLKENEAKIHELTYLFWECTQRCNLSCIHCGSDCIENSRIPDMPFGDFFKAVLPISKLHKQLITIVFTGGEPLLRNDLTECGRALRENGFRWGIVTNGMLYNREIHSKLLGAGMGSLTLSIDGLEKSHNWLRNNNKSFLQAVEALDIITLSGRLNFDVVTCVNTKNIYELPELKSFLISRNVKAWRLFTIAPIGRAKNNNELQLNAAQIKYLMEFIASSREEHTIDVKFSCEAYTGKYEKKVRDNFFFCRAGINIASVLIDGSISACPNINRNFAQGNIYKDNFLDIWENKFEIMRNREWTKTGICQGCKDYNNCQGGAMHLWNDAHNNISTCINKLMIENS